MSKSKKNSLNSVILPIIRRVKPKAIAKDLVGVQPMTGPLPGASILKYRYGDERTTLWEEIKEIERERKNEQTKRLQARHPTNH